MINSIDNIEKKQIIRYQTGFKYFDYILGNDNIYFNENKELINQSGFPSGSLSLLTASAGCGKTRFMTQVSAKMNSSFYKTIYFQNEMTLQQMVSKSNVNIEYKENYLVSDSLQLQTMIQQIKKQLPHFVVIDSINQIDGYTKLDGLKSILKRLRECSKETNCHIAIIAQQNKDGTIKGNSVLSHMVDIEMRMSKENYQYEDYLSKDNKYIYLFIDKKNRFGQVGGWVRFKHTDMGIQYADSHYIPSAKNSKNNKKFDIDYINVSNSKESIENQLRNLSDQKLNKLHDQLMSSSVNKNKNDIMDSGNPLLDGLGNLCKIFKFR